MVTLILHWAQAITDYLNRNGIIQNDIEIYQFGFVLCISTMMSFGQVILVGIICDILPYTLCYLILFTVLRVHVGGYHCTTYLKCQCTYLMIFLIYMLLRYIDINVWVAFMMYIIASFTIWIYAPVQHPLKPLTRIEKKSFSKKSKLLVVVFGIALYLAHLFDKGLSYTVWYCLLANACLLTYGEVVYVQKNDFKNDHCISL